MRAFVAAVLIATQLTALPAWAYDLEVGKEGGGPAMPSLTSEFIYRNEGDEALIPVYLLGAVAKPGLYHVPGNTDLVSLLALAGGPVSGAQTDNILVKGQGAAVSAPRREIRFDLEGSVRSADAGKVGLMSNDLVYVTPGKPPITTDVLTFLGIATGVLTLITSVVLVRQNLSK